MSSPPAKPVSKLRVRVISGLLIGGVVSLAAVLGGYAWGGLSLLMFFPLAYHEMLGLMRAKSIQPSKVTITLFGTLFYLFALQGWERHFDVLISVGLIFTFSWLLLRKNPASISDIGATIMMFFYLGFLPAHYILIRNLGAEAGDPFWQQPGFGYLFFILFAVSASDIFAYFGGKRFGKNLLSPQISPRKTVEGSIAGAFMAVLIAVGISFIIKMPWYHGAILGLLINLVAQMGDLSESLLKRDAGLKDSGSFIPGHGGLLDRTDSYIFCGAVAYYYINWFVLHQGLAREVIEFFAAGRG